MKLRSTSPCVLSKSFVTFVCVTMYVTTGSGYAPVALVRNLGERVTPSPLTDMWRIAFAIDDAFGATNRPAWFLTSTVGASDIAATLESIHPIVTTSDGSAV